MVSETTFGSLRDHRQYDSTEAISPGMQSANDGLYFWSPDLGGNSLLWTNKNSNAPQGLQHARENLAAAGYTCFESVLNLPRKAPKPSQFFASSPVSKLETGQTPTKSRMRGEDGSVSPTTSFTESWNLFLRASIFSATLRRTLALMAWNASCDPMAE